jgi:hypothetical protein
MKPFSRDTHPDAHAVYVRLLREKTVPERLAMVVRLNEAADAMAMARIRRQYPGDSARTQRLRLQALKYSDELMRTVFGWDPELEGR